MASAWKVSGVSMVTSDRPRVRGSERCFERTLYNTELAIDPGFEMHTIQNGSTDIAERFASSDPQYTWYAQQWFIDESQLNRWDVVDTDPHEGIYHARVIQTGGGSALNWRWLEVVRPGQCIATPANGMAAAVVPDAEITLSAMIKVNRTDTDVSVLVDFDFYTDFYPNGGTISGPGQNTLHDINSTSYTEYSHTATVPANAKVCRAFFWPRFVGTGASAETILDLDTVSLVMTPA